jgi:hypothetical protein
MHCGFEKSKRRGKKQVYVENTVLPNVTLWNTGFQWMRTIFVVVACICTQKMNYELTGARPFLPIGRSEGQHLRTCNTALQLPKVLSRGFVTDWAPTPYQ